MRQKYKKKAMRRIAKHNKSIEKSSKKNKTDREDTSHKDNE